MNGGILIFHGSTVTPRNGAPLSPKVPNLCRCLKNTPKMPPLFLHLPLSYFGTHAQIWLSCSEGTSLLQKNSRTEGVHKTFKHAVRAKCHDHQWPVSVYPSFLPWYCPSLLSALKCSPDCSWLTTFDIHCLAIDVTEQIQILPFLRPCVVWLLIFLCEYYFQVCKRRNRYEAF